ncbi:hypothetical protein R1flu_004132 [Riccia fluitans]|uniref:Caleosin n=1 Tax=Riccia fluitans TaxID=41844 RepID=A0ABD1YPP6_9MARC
MANQHHHLKDETAISTPRAPVTMERPVPTDLNYDRPYMARALKAVDGHHPYGSEGYDNQGYSVLQQHVAYFDLNGDGIVYPWETYKGFRAIGFNVIISFIAMILINGAFSYNTLPTFIPSLLFPIYINRIHKCKHGSDSGTYDTEGRFLPIKYEELWTKFAKTYPDKMNFKELWHMTNAMRVAYDPFGWVGNKLEWILTFSLAKDEEGYLAKEAVRGVFDGSFFQYVENLRKNQHLAKQKLK